MRRWQGVGLLVLIGLLLLRGAPGHAQGAPPLVVFVEDQRLQTASMIDPGPDGLTQLEQLFVRLGARTAWIRLSDPIPEDAQVVVLVRPVTALPLDYLARLWVHVARGGHLLLAIDPSGSQTARPDKPVVVNTEKAAGPLSTLLTLYFGVSLQDTFLIEPWFAHAVIANQRTAFSRVYAEPVVRHAVTDPLIAADLPVQVWGARSLDIEPFGPYSRAVPLLYTESAYGETNRDVFAARAEPVPLEINLGQDIVGRLLIAALAENTLSGARLALLGDSELLENDFGLGLYATDQQPVHWGNRVLVERIAAWLLDAPAAQWRDLPANFTRIAIDGDASDWAERAVLAEDRDALEIPSKDHDVSQIRAFYDDSYLYVLVEMANTPPADAQIAVGIENTWDGTIDFWAICEHGQMAMNAVGVTVPLSDASCAIGAAIELRIPKRLTGVGGLVTQLCVSPTTTAIGRDAPDCVGGSIGIIPEDRTTAPLDTAGVTGPLVSVFSPQAVNLRAAPGTDSAVVTSFASGTLLEPIGRTEAGDWIKVQNARFSGWMAATLVRANFAIERLPVIDLSAITPAEAAPTAEGATPPGTGAPTAGRTHVVQAGDTLFAIARQYGTTVEALVEANNLGNSRIIVVGQVLVIP